MLKGIQIHKVGYAQMQWNHPQPNPLIIILLRSLRLVTTDYYKPLAKTALIELRGVGY